MLGRRPALDGLRALAVVAVVVEHSLPRQPGSSGTVGVTLFLVLSGFLITRILLEENANSGHIDLRAFINRRFRRLAPAFALYLLAIGIASAATGVTLAPVLVAGLYVSNVAAAIGMPLLSLGHTWSLAMEEQFYLLWPVALIGLLRVRKNWAMLLLVGAVVLCGAWRASLAAAAADYPRVAFAPDTRVDALIVGCVLALMASRLPMRASGGLAAGGAVVMFAACGVELLEISVALSPVAVAAATVVWWGAIADVGGYAYRVLTWSPLRWVGTVSYGIYLWHEPFAHFMAMTFTAWIALPLTFAAALAVATLSWRCIEMPLRSGQPRPAETALVRSPGRNG